MFTNNDDTMVMVRHHSTLANFEAVMVYGRISYFAAFPAESMFVNTILRKECVAVDAAVCSE